MAKGERGFTLIELLVVVAIIGLGVTAVIFALPGNDRTLYADADRFAARVAAARDLAVVGGQPVALWVSPSGYGFEQRIEGQWQPMSARGIDRADWRDGTMAMLGDDGMQRLAFDNNGLPNEGIVVELRNGETAAAISVNDLGEVSVDR
ncbi:GspH/FimT family pseudopilin [Alterisphingorhabdus coralli]|uniref:Type II secretion system protein H n=1 Tax=Alterisphingorhabdus coralli TaxID=3071408 RepID=A0AA97I198_9SPHN|nr:GspH/FimT family pseudopilin [Parasphingorhabdus sp. SCSIO 66989]WOE75842.1 GspH/FimT family pseudopilin [Parasphingorhabdus sp. SCSIO 66989]